MDPWLETLPVVVLGLIVAGVAVVAWRVSERQQLRIPPQEEPVVPPGAAAVLSVLRSGTVVLNADDVVLKASAPAYALGLVRGNELVSEELRGLVREVRRDGQIRETELVQPPAPGSAERTLSVRVAPLGSRLVLALVDDRTRERRVEAVRRDFVANVSHELKTPVGAIRLLAEAVQDAADDPAAVHRFAGRTLTESERLSRLVLQIIELSRLQGDDPIDAPAVVAVDKMLATAVDAAVIDADARGVTVVIGGEAGLEALGSEEQLAVAVGNLVANSVAYSPSGSTVLVCASGRADFVDISVVDQGIGIPAGEVDRIFERFYRIDPARHRSTGGTGLGLSIVKHVAATHGGEVRVWSVEGQGSTFTLSVPRSPEECRSSEEERP